MGEDTASAFVKAINSPGTITDREIVQLWAYLNSAVLSVQQTHTMFELGLATEEDQKVAARIAAQWLGWNFGRVWWAEIKSDFSSDLVTEIDAAIAAIDPNYLTHQLQGMKDGMARRRSCSTRPPVCTEIRNPREAPRSLTGPDNQTNASRAAAHRFRLG